MGVRLVAEAFENADEGTKNKLGDCLYDEQGTRWSSVRSLLEGLPDEGQALREHIFHEEEEHR